MSLGRKIWKWSAAILGLLLVISALIVGGLRIWLEHSPAVSNDIVARVEAVTGLRLRFDRLDTRLGWFGPELVFRQARILAHENGATVVSARAGRVGFDVWQALKTGRLASARVRLDGAIVHLVITQNGIELLDQDALKRGETDSTPLKIENLPVGRVRIDDGQIEIVDQRPGHHSLSFEHVRVDLTRDRHTLNFSALANLPDSLGTRLTAKGTIEGSGADGEPPVWSATAVGAGLHLAGIGELLGDLVRLPRAGLTDLDLAFAGRGFALSQARAKVTAKELLLEPLAGGAPLPAALRGEFTLERPAKADGTPGETWKLAGHDLGVTSGTQSFKAAEFAAELTLLAGVPQAVRLQVPTLELAPLDAFASLLPQASLREAAAALAPRGRLEAVDLTARRLGAPGAWSINGAGHVRGLTIGAYRAVPGFSGVDADFTGEGEHGSLKVAARPFTLDLAQFLRAPVGAESIEASATWSHAEDGWHLASDDARAVTRDGSGGGLVRLWIPSLPQSPHVVLDLNIRDAEIKSVARYLPGLRFGADVNTWLDAAFLGGKVPQARLQYVGPTEGFPFRDRQGLFLVQGTFTGAHIHYADGWADVEDVSGEMEFRNQGFHATAHSGRIGGLAIGESQGAMEDFRDADIKVTGSASGDLHKALKLIQESPVGKPLGSYFAALDGRGPVSAAVDLFLPLRHLGDRRIDVEAKLEHATARLPGVDEEVSNIDGSLKLHNFDLSVPQLTATLFGGPVTIRGETVVNAGAKPGLHTTSLHVTARSLASHLAPQLGITQGNYLGGATDWRAEVTVPHVEWLRPLPPKPPEVDLFTLRELKAGRPAPVRPDDRPPLARKDPEIRVLPLNVHVESQLAGLELKFPAPLAKDAGDKRPLKLDATIDPGITDKDPLPPAALGLSLSAHPPHIQAAGALGPDSFIGEWAVAAQSEDRAAPLPGLTLNHATAHFGAGVARLREAGGVWLEGRLPRYDLSAWLRVKTSDKPGKPMNSWLRGGELSIDRFDVFGFELGDVHAELAAGEEGWLIHATGPDAAGSVKVPYDLASDRPVDLKLEHITLNNRQAEEPGSGPRDPPASIPPVIVHAGNVEFLKRKLGEVDAVLTRIEGGLKLEHGDARAPSFTAHATGRWTGEGDSELCEVDALMHSTDVQATLVALNLDPSLTGASAEASGQLRWKDGIDGTILERLQGRAHVQVRQGQILTVQPGAGRVLGLMSLATLPRRLALDFHDLTDKGFAFDSIDGDYDFRDGNAYTNNLVVKGPAAEIGLIGRTGFKAQDYDQIAVVTGHFSDGLAAATALANPVVGGALFLFGRVFQGALEGIARGYYRITGSWDKPKIDRIGSNAAHEVEAASGALLPGAVPGPGPAPGPALGPGPATGPTPAPTADPDPPAAPPPEPPPALPASRD